MLRASNFLMIVAFIIAIIGLITNETVLFFVSFALLVLSGFCYIIHRLLPPIAYTSPFGDDDEDEGENEELEGGDDDEDNGNATEPVPAKNRELKKADQPANPYAAFVDVPWDRYTEMRERQMVQIKELPNQDTPQFMAGGRSLTPAELRDEIYIQTTLGKNYVQMMVKEEMAEEAEAV
ncbi:hypothetical protein IPM19_00735 [bacterium]|nr:MAG: hypothetical protein IPM19_00735 [bacterium]